MTLEVTEVSANITGGSIKYGETRKIADFENKRADVELFFNLDEGQDHDKIINFVKTRAKKHCVEMLAPEIKTVRAEVQTKAEAAPISITAPVAMGIDPGRLTSPASAPAMPVVVTSPGFSRSEPAPKIEAPVTGTVITDAELMDATTKHQQHVKNAIAIKKLIRELGVTTPPGRLIDLAQDKRQEYLDRLKDIKPLA